MPFEEDSTKIPRMLDELSRVGWVRLGKDDQERSVGEIVKFRKHQRVDRPKCSEIKGLARFDEPSTKSPRTIDEQSTEEGKGMERNGMESSPEASPSGGEGNSNLEPQTDPKTPIKGLYKASKESSADPRHHAIMQLWAPAYVEAHGFDYVCSGGRDGTELKKFLEVAKATTPPEFMEVAKGAWTRHKEKGDFAKACKLASTIHGLCQNWNPVRVELQNSGAVQGGQVGPQPEDPPAPAYSVSTSRECDEPEATYEQFARRCAIERGDVEPETDEEREWAGHYVS